MFSGKHCKKSAVNNHLTEKPVSFIFVNLSTTSLTKIVGINNSYMSINDRNNQNKNHAMKNRK